MSNTSINLVNIDFDQLKGSLKDYMKAQTAFLDYDFDGPNISVLLDIMTYNTFHNAFYLNMVASESYLDSAQLRNSIISHAKELNYVPRSSRSAKATVNLNFSADSNIVTIPKGTSFTSLVGLDLLTFVTDDESVHFSSNNTFSIQNISIYEGHDTSDQYIVNYENPTQRFIISDALIDTRSITVTVIEDNIGTKIPYAPASTTLDLEKTSTVYFLQACEDGKYEIIFGDNIIGRRPKDNAIIEVDYRVCNQEAGNGAAKFTLDQAFANFTTSPNVYTVDVSRGGASAEDDNSIKYYAPRYFQTQERAVNTADYELILRQRFPEINSIAAYGGEELTPPQFGRVYIAVDIADVDGLPTSKVDEYFAFLKPRSPLSIDPVFVNPEYLYYTVSSSIKYNVNDTSLNPEQIRSMVVNKIITYSDTYLNNFKASFRYSKFVANIDSVEDAGIISNDTDITIYKKFIPVIGENRDVNVLFDIELTNEGAVLGNSYDTNDLTAVSSSDFIFNGDKVHINDDGNGNLRLVKSFNDKNFVVVPDIGTVSYSTGTVKLINFRVDGFDNGVTSLKIYGVTKSRDFSTSKNVILALETNELDINIVPVRETTSLTQSRQRA